MYPNIENMIVVPITKRIRLLWVSKFISFHRWTLIIRKLVERKAFSCKSKALIWCIQLWRAWLLPITKRMEIIRSIPVCLISWMNFDYKENGRKKNFSSKSKASISCNPIEENMIVVLITKSMEIIMGIQVYLISWINFHYKRNGGNKSFSCKCKASISSIPMRKVLITKE